MAKKSTLLNKTLVLGIFILFIGMSVVSSTGSIDENNTSYTQILDEKDSSEELLLSTKYGYAYNAYPGPEGTVYFPLDDPGNITECGETISSDFLVGGTMKYDEIWYGVQYGNGLLYGVDPYTCEMWIIGGGGPGPGDIAWDDWTGKLYSSSMMGLAFNNEGTCYGVDKDGSVYNLYIIDFDPYEETLIGTLINFTSEWLYFLNAEFDKDTNILYILTSQDLYICDTETRECTFVGSTGGIELTALAIPYDYYDTTPFTEISLDPPDPDGENGWYVSNVTVTLTAKGFIYGVNVTYYRINGGEWETYTSPFTIFEEGDDILIEFYSVDNNGTAEDVKSETIDIDKTIPNVKLTLEIFGNNQIPGWEILLKVIASDSCSGIDRIEFYFNDELQETVSGPGPEYYWRFTFGFFKTIRLNGLIFDLDITEKNVSFYALVVKASKIDIFDLIFKVCVFDMAGNVDCNETEVEIPEIINPGLYLFERLTLPNNYSGYIGKFLIFAFF